MGLEVVDAFGGTGKVLSRRLAHHEIDKAQEYWASRAHIRNSGSADEGKHMQSPTFEFVPLILAVPSLYPMYWRARALDSCSRLQVQAEARQHSRPAS